MLNLIISRRTEINISVIFALCFTFFPCRAASERTEQSIFFVTAIDALNLETGRAVPIWIYKVEDERSVVLSKVVDPIVGEVFRGVTYLPDYQLLLSIWSREAGLHELNISDLSTNDFQVTAIVDTTFEIVDLTAKQSGNVLNMQYSRYNDRELKLEGNVPIQTFTRSNFRVVGTGIGSLVFANTTRFEANSVGLNRNVVFLSDSLVLLSSILGGFSDTLELPKSLPILEGKWSVLGSSGNVFVLSCIPHRRNDSTTNIVSINLITGEHNQFAIQGTESEIRLESGWIISNVVDKHPETVYGSHRVNPPPRRNEIEVRTLTSLKPASRRFSVDSWILGVLSDSTFFIRVGDTLKLSRVNGDGSFSDSTIAVDKMVKFARFAFSK